MLQESRRSAWELAGSAATESIRADGLACEPLQDSVDANVRRFAPLRNSAARSIVGHCVD
eukprot:4150945-Pleurochrysis_carterae.AAC.1